MSKAIKVSVSVLCSNFLKLGEEIKKCEAAGVDHIHIDVMDGHFVPNISIGLPIVQAVRSATTLPLDVHLMIENPWEYIAAFAEAGADSIYVQVECYGERLEGCREYGQYPKVVHTINADALKRDIKHIHQLGKKAYVVLNPGTPIECIDKVLADLDGVLIMSVNPGFAFQKFMSEVLSKIEYLSSRFKGDIAIDGGIKEETAPLAVKAGANVLATASYFFGAQNPSQIVQFLKNLK